MIIKNSHVCTDLIKLHKHTTGSRFIIAAPKCSVKHFAKTITSILRLFFMQIKAYNDYCTSFFGVKTFSKDSFEQSASDRCHQQN